MAEAELVVETRDLGYLASAYYSTSTVSFPLETRQATIGFPLSEVAAGAASDQGTQGASSAGVSGLSLQVGNSLVLRSAGQVSATGLLAAEGHIQHIVRFHVTTPTTLRFQALQGLGGQLTGVNQSFIYLLEGDSTVLARSDEDTMDVPVDVTVALQPQRPYVLHAYSHAGLAAFIASGTGEFHLDALLTFAEGGVPAPPPSTGVPCVTAIQVGPPTLTALANGETRWRTRFDVRNGGSQALGGVALAVTSACTGPNAAGGCPTASSRMRWDEARGRWAASVDDSNEARALQSERSAAVGAALMPRPEFNVNAGDHVAAFPVGTLAAGESRAVNVDWAFAPGAPSTFHFQGQFLAQSGACSVAATPVPVLPGRSLGLLGVGLAAVAALATRRRRQSA